MATQVLKNTFEHSKTGFVGDKRETMLINELHVKPRLGKVFYRGHTIPEGFTFGRKNYGMDGGAGEALHGWPSYNQSVKNIPSTSTGPSGEESDDMGDVKLPTITKTLAEKDFLALNKAAVAAGVARPHEVACFRANTQIFAKEKVGDGGKDGKSKQRRLPPTMVFGISTRPGTPIYELLQHRYQDSWLESMRAREDALDKSADAKSKPKGRQEVVHTKTSLLRSFVLPVDSAPLWKLPKFEKSKTHISTFRNRGSLEKAAKNFEYDKVARRGSKHGGIYQEAQS